MSISYPYFSYAKKHKLNYGLVLWYVDRVEIFKQPGYVMHMLNEHHSRASLYITPRHAARIGELIEKEHTRRASV